MNQPTDYRIPSDNKFKPDHYIVDGKEFGSKVETVKYVKTALGCTINEAQQYVIGLPDFAVGE